MVMPCPQGEWRRRQSRSVKLNKSWISESVRKENNEFLLSLFYRQEWCIVDLEGEVKLDRKSHPKENDEKKAFFNGKRKE